MGKKRIVVDTNILISALGWKGKPRSLVQSVINKDFELCTSIKQLAELRRVMNYPKFAFTEHQKSSFIQIISSLARVIHTKTEPDIASDKDDNMILACAIDSGAEYILTGDDDLLRLKEYGNVRIMTVEQFLKQ